MVTTTVYALPGLDFFLGLNFVPVVLLCSAVRVSLQMPPFRRLWYVSIVFLFICIFSNQMLDFV